VNKDNISAILTAVAVISLIAGFGIYFNFYTTASQSYVAQKHLENSVGQSLVKNGDLLILMLNKTAFTSIDKSGFVQAPELIGIDSYINTVANEPIHLSNYKGKVVLLDFWTYTCINCIRTIPHLNDWYDRYADQGLVIIGVHSPEFDFEKNLENVQNAVKEFGIKYPVVLDSEHKTWDAYNNNYWPRHYLIDSQGYIRDDHIGEGGYNETEKTIQTLLAEKAALDNKTEISFNVNKPGLTNNTTGALEYTDFNQNISPEIYLGYSTARSQLGNVEGFQPNQTINYKFDPNMTSLDPNIVYLGGVWKNNKDNMELVSDEGKIILNYYAKAINIVASGNGQKISIIDNNGSKVNTKNHAVDIGKDGNITTDKQRLYNVGLYNDYQPRSITLDVKGKGFQIFTFTFG
jgi:thiol-disulfide isomerase/thioredoxin